MQFKVYSHFYILHPTHYPQKTPAAKNIHFILQKHLVNKSGQNFTSLPKTFFPSGEKFFSN